MDESSPSPNYRELLEHSVDVISVLNESGVIRFESHSIERMLGYSPVELVGESVFDYIHPDDRERTREIFFETIEASSNDRTGRVELRFRRKDGS